MKKFIGDTRQTMKNYWRNMMQSHCLKMPCGAQYIDKMIAWSRGENWRGNRKKKK
ncbi:MAG: hypothetical protein ACD_64C00228G0002 [uncultured bacterium]|nr:MAG: hypothetical protein ACD_64C00228G0002 [uncultured bacterium]